MCVQKKLAAAEERLRSARLEAALAEHVAKVDPWATWSPGATATASTTPSTSLLTCGGMLTSTSRFCWFEAVRDI